MTRVFLTGGSGLIGGALAARLVERGDEVVALARSDAAERALAARGVARVVRGDVLDEAALTAGMEGCALLYHVAGINTMCPDDPAAMFHVNVRGAELAVRAASRAGVPRVVLTSSAAALGEAHGTVGSEDSPHRGSYLSIYERTKHEGELAALAAARSDGIELVAVNPSSVQGPGRAGGTGRILIAYLNGKLPAFVDTQLSLVDIADCVEAHVLAAERGDARRALRDQRRDALGPRGAGRRRRDRRPAAHAAAPAAARRARRRGRRRDRVPRPRQEAAGVPGDGPHAAPRPPLRRHARDARARARLHARRGDVPAHDRVGAGAGPRARLTRPGGG